MGLPALLFPQSWMHHRTWSDQESRHFEQFRELLEGVRRDRPDEGTTSETFALARVARLSLASVRLFGPGFVMGVRGNLNAALTELIRKETEAAHFERKLALRHIEQAVHRFGVLIESVSAAVADLPPASLMMLFDEASADPYATIVGDERVLLRFQLDLLVALDVLDAPIEELSFWAFRVINDARRVEALAPPIISRGELARIRTRRAWLGWDAAELAKELAPWPDPTQ